MAEASKTQSDKPKASRSPTYPSMDLKEAIKKATALFEKNKRFPMPIASVATTLDYTSTSSSFASAIATLRAYGLVDITGSGDQRKVAVSDRAARIILNHPDKSKLLKAAALDPPIFNELWTKFYKKGEGLSPDDAMSHHLTLDRENGTFQVALVPGLLADFRATVELARLEDGAILSESGEKRDVRTPAAGDSVQWVSQGVAQFVEPRVVRGLSEDGQYAFIEGEKTGVPVSQLTVEKPAVPGEKPPANPFAEREIPAQKDMTEATFPLDEGKAVLRWPAKLSAQSFGEFEDWIKLVLKKAKRTAEDGKNPE